MGGTAPSTPDITADQIVTSAADGENDET